jgi:hypothetical protein
MSHRCRGFEGHATLVSLVHDIHVTQLHNDSEGRPCVPVVGVGDVVAAGVHCGQRKTWLLAANLWGN